MIYSVDGSKNIIMFTRHARCHIHSKKAKKGDDNGFDWIGFAYLPVQMDVEEQQHRGSKEARIILCQV